MVRLHHGIHLQRNYQTMASAYSYFALLTDWIDQEELAETWHDITLDSYIVDIRKSKKQKNTDTARQLQRYVNTLLNSAIYQWKIPFMLS